MWQGNAHFLSNIFGIQVAFMCYIFYWKVNTNFLYQNLGKFSYEEKQCPWNKKSIFCQNVAIEMYFTLLLKKYEDFSYHRQSLFNSKFDLAN